MIYRVKNWESFQHYKHRSPPWIKLHKQILDDMEFQCLPDASRALAMCIWLIASESSDGTFDGTPKKLAFRVRQSESWIEKALKPLESEGFIVVVQVASKPLAKHLQDATTEKSREEKSRDRVEKSNTPLACIRPDDVAESVWNDFLALRKIKKAPVSETALNGLRAESLKAGVSLESALQTCCERGWQGFKGEWLTNQGKGNGNGKFNVMQASRKALERALAEEGMGVGNPQEILPSLPN